ncbi:hypothetical protein CLU82_0267 [Flavobacterium sp. 5]|nr:hypothetical protein CLU82_0267 [Flavobacterium sp. 5]
MFFLLLLFGILLDKIPKMENWKIKLISYFSIVALTYFLQKKFKIFQILFQILILPFSIFFVVFAIGIPFLILQMHLLIYFALCFFIPSVFFQLYEYLQYPPINIQLKVYVILSFSVICSVVFQKQIKYIVHTFSPARLKTSEKLRPYKIGELSDYLLSESNIKFLVFIIYFVIIVCVNFYNFQNLSYYDSEKIDKAVLQSFVTYIAFDRIISNLKQVEFKPSEMVKKMKNSIFNKMEQLDNINK